MTGSVLEHLGDLATDSFDLIVAGAGAGGLSAGLFAAIRGARVLVIEESGLVGGTTSFTAGTLWVPGTRNARAVGAPPDDLEAARGFLDRAIGDAAPSALREAFLAAGADAIATLEDSTRLVFDPSVHHPDYMAEVDGSATNGRTLEVREMHGAELGPDLRYVRQQCRELTVLGGLTLSRPDLATFAAVARNPLPPRVWPMVGRAGVIVAHHLLGRLLHRRATRLTMGTALVGRLLWSLRDRGVHVLVSTSIEEIICDGGRITGVRVRQRGLARTLTTSRGLISATGGFNHDRARRARLLPGIRPEWSAVSEGTTARLHGLIERLGGRYGEPGESAAFWAPVSLPPRRGGGHGVYPHFAMDRAKPGFVVVDQRGRRYLNESTSYHRFGLAMQAHDKESASLPSYLIGDAKAVRRYGIGAVRPGGWGRRRRLQDGYLVRGSSLEQLARRLGADSKELIDSVRRVNAYARTGVDPEFGRGSTVYERTIGDASHGPNPSLGALSTAPYYAIRLYPGDIGAAVGFRTDVNAQVLDADDDPIPGLYAVGNDMQSVMGGRYPAPGITLGPAVVFSYLAVRHALAHRVRHQAPS